MIEVHFSRNDDGPVHGFDLGDISVSGAGFRLATPNRAMVYLSIVVLLDGLSKLIQAQPPGRFQFVAPDSSFTVLFTKASDARMGIESSGEIVYEADIREVVDGVWRGVKAFLSVPGLDLTESDPVYEDFADSLGNFRRILEDGLW